MIQTYHIYFKRDEHDAECQNLRLETDDFSKLADLLAVLSRYGYKWVGKDAREEFKNIDELLASKKNESDQGSPSSG